MDDVSPEQIHKSVLIQSGIRVKLGVPVALVAILINVWSQPGGAHASTTGAGVVTAYILYAFVTFFVSRHPGPLSWRDIAIGTAILDPVILSAWLFAEGESAILVMGFYLFTILGFGFRIGPNIMRVCQGVSILGFAWVLIVSPFWSNHPFFGLSHLILLVAVPMYAGSLMRDLRDAKALAEHESKAKTQLLANVSHELRTPLTGIVSAAQLLEGHVEASEAKLVQSILQLSGSLDTEISQLLDLSKQGVQPASGPPVPFDLTAITGHVLTALGESAAAKGIKFCVVVDERIDRPVLGQPRDLTSVLMNLAGNAVKFTHEGSVTLEIKLTASDDRSYALWFGVTDTGIGIAPEHQGKLFEPFYRVETGDRRQYRGTGLGTTIAREYVRRMGGELQLSSSVGKGTVFWFEVEMPIAQAVAPVSEQPFAPVLSPKRILVADDNALNLELLQKMLAKDGHVVSVAHGGNEALQQLASSPFDVVMLDFNMDDLDGLTVFQTYCFGRINPAPTFFVTADTSSATASKLNKAGASGVIYKPLTFEKLRGALVSVFPAEAGVEAARLDAGFERASVKLAAVPVEHVDVAILETLREIKDDPKFIHAIIGDGISDINALLQQLSLATAGKDLRAVHHLAHALRGVGLNIGAVRLGAQCERLMSLTGRQLNSSNEKLRADLATTGEATLAELEELRAPFADASLTA
jgi:two-component system sensor histidine kinase RpfC